jgi:hypothetical protein
MTELALFELLTLDCRVDTYGAVCYYNALGQQHRVHGPAVEYADGHREWWQNGQLHRLGGPAIEYTDGSRAWFQNGWLHRMDGPAIVNADGGCEWFINGNELTEAEWQQVVANMDPV